jgi:hypothetical protein
MKRKITFKIPQQHEVGPRFGAGGGGGMAGGSNGCKWHGILRKCRKFVRFVRAHHILSQSELSCGYIISFINTSTIISMAASSGVVGETKNNEYTR